MRNQLEALAAEYGLHPHRISHVLDRYGSMIRDVLDPGLTDPALLETVPGAPDYLMAEIRYAVTHEGALHLEDVLTRRTRISIEYPHRGVDVRRARSPTMMGDDPRLGRTRRATPRSSSYVARVEAERESQSHYDDEAADEVRTAAPEVRTYLSA